MNKTLYLTSAFKPLPLQVLLRSSSTASKTTSLHILNHYEVLGVERTASSDDIRDAFLKLSKECHPDKNSQDPKTHDKFVQVNEAYTVLSKGLSRRDYDLSLKARESTRYHYRPSPRSRGQSYYHDSKSHFYDPYIYSMRDKSQDKYYENQPYYGVKGLPKLSNTHIILTCFGIIIVGSIFHYFAVKKSSSLHIKSLNERDVKTHKLWRDANDPTFFNQRLQELRSQIQENEAKK